MDGDAGLRVGANFKDEWPRAVQLCDRLAAEGLAEVTAAVVVAMAASWVTPWAGTEAEQEPATPAATGPTNRSSLTLLLTTLSLRSNELKLTRVRVALAMMRIFFRPSTNLESSSISCYRETDTHTRPKADNKRQSPTDPSSTLTNNCMIAFSTKKEAKSRNSIGFLSKELTSLRDFNSSQLKLLSNRAKKRLSTKKLPITKAGRKMEKQISEPYYMFFLFFYEERNQMKIMKNWGYHGDQTRVTNSQRNITETHRIPFSSHTIP